jgi:hypothetical protein
MDEQDSQDTKSYYESWWSVFSSQQQDLHRNHQLLNIDETTKYTKDTKTARKKKSGWFVRECYKVTQTNAYLE